MSSNGKFYIEVVRLVPYTWKKQFLSSFRYALVDFGLAQGTADTQIELLKVVKHGALQKGGGSTGKQDNTQRGKAAVKVPPKNSTASTSAAGPRQQRAPSSSPSTAPSSTSRKALVKKAHSVTVTVPTSTSCSKHTKVSALYLYSAL